MQTEVSSNDYSGISDLIQLHQQIEKSRAAQQPPKRSRPFVDVSAILNQPDFAWIIRDIMPEKSFGMIWGPPGCLKSFMAIEVAGCLATGLPTLGVFKTERKRVAYLCSEGGYGLKKRLQAWMNAKGVTPADLDNLRISTHAFSLDIEINDFEAELKQGFGDVRPEVVIIDTLARNFGGDENSTKDMTRFTNMVADFGKTFGVTVLLIHHSGKEITKGPRGNNSVIGAVDWHMRMVKAEGGGGATASILKQKDGKEPEFLINATEVTLPNEQTTLVLTHGGVPNKDNQNQVTTDDLLPVLSACIKPAAMTGIVEATGTARATAERYVALATRMGFLSKIEGNRTKDNPNRWELTHHGSNLVVNKGVAHLPKMDHLGN